MYNPAATSNIGVDNSGLSNITPITGRSNKPNSDCVALKPSIHSRVEIESVNT